MTCMIVPAWSERGPAPRRNRVNHPIKHYAETGRSSKPGSPKLTLRGPQAGTTNRKGPKK